jgi:endonuclease/exonuclease/phosphatase family metal-dependent hydrolase
MGTRSGMTRRGALAVAGTVGAMGAVGSSLAAAPAYAGGREVIGRARGHDIHAMSFNIRYDRSPATRPGEPDHWPERAPLVTRFLEIEKPTVLGVQEAEFHQLAAVEAGLGPHYRMLGFGRGGGAAGEYSSIFYDATRLTALWWDQYWLSGTPDVIGSATWGNTVTRIVTWVRFHDRRSDREFVHLNSHFDHRSENARVRSAETTRDQVAGLDVPVVLTADFNAAAEASAPYDVLVTDGGLQDTWVAAEQRLTPRVGTFPNYGATDPDGDRIDWVLATPDVRVRAVAINPWTSDGRYPSDHLPVQALLRLT